MENKNKSLILEKLYALQRFGIKPGLDRTRNLLWHIGNPHQMLKTIHVAGTNGKGSVCSLIASILTSAGYKVGLYTSPHIVDFNERIRINGEKISDDDIIRMAEELLLLQPNYNCTFFEITTAMAFQYFAEKQVDIAVIETGLGGRFDSTNVIEPIVSVITNIDYDHSEYLGEELENIAFEKAGIIKDNTPVVISDSKPEITKVFISKSQECNSPIFFASQKYKIELIAMERNLSMLLNISSNGITFENVEVQLAGKHQFDNILSALTTINILKNSYNISNDNILAGLRDIRKTTGLVGRIHLISVEPPIIIDAAHNPSSLKALVDTIAISPYSNIKWNIVFGVMADKNIYEMLSLLKPIVKTLIITQPHINRAEETNLIKKIAEDIGLSDIVEIDDVAKATDCAIEQKTATLFTGSFYLLGEAVPVIKKYFQIEI